MKKLMAIFTVIVSLSNIAFADCDFSTGIAKQPDGQYLYSRDCNIKVGQMKQDLDTVNEQLTQYKKAIDLKDLALTKTEERANLWSETSFKLQDRMSAVDDLKSRNQMWTFIAGVAFTAVAVWGAGHLSGK